jgi:glycosyltransferase involved in cell wall biosynthesis
MLRLPTLALPRNESRFSALTWLKTTLAAEHLVRSIRPEVIAAFTHPANMVAGMAARLHGTSAIWGQRDEGIFKAHPRIERLTFAACTAAVANGPGPFDYLQELSPRDPRITTIHNGVKIEHPISGRDAWRVRIGIPPDGQLVTMVANLTRAKDHPTLLRAWRMVEDGFPHAHLACAGRLGDNTDAVTALIRSLDLERVHLVGPTDDVTGLYRASDIAVLSSRSEGQSNAVLEAMSCDLPVIASDIPGCHSVLPHGPLVPPGDAPALAAAIRRLLASTNLRSEIGVRNGAAVRMNFSADVFLERYSALLQAACRIHDDRWR